MNYEFINATGVIKDSTTILAIVIQVSVNRKVIQKISGTAQSNIRASGYTCSQFIWSGFKLGFKPGLSLNPELNLAIVKNS